MKVFSFYLVVLIEICFSLKIVKAFNARNNTKSYCYFANDQCPNEDIQFWLYTRDSADNPLLLNIMNLTQDLFPDHLPLKILIHGFNLNRNLSPNLEVRPLLLQHGSVYVISMDYSVLVRNICYYPWAVSNTPIVAKCLALFINNLIDQGLYTGEDIHIIGFSLGAQIAGLASNDLNHRIKRITGLDPAKPGFMTNNLNEKLDPSDAEFVDVIHTDTIFYSTSMTMGHADFYPNYREFPQPGCSLLQEFRNCNHYRANAYYAESIITDKGFWSYNCGSTVEFLNNQCSSYGSMEHVQMGYFVDEKVARGSYFLITNSKSPYAKGPMMQVELEVADKMDLKFDNL